MLTKDITLRILDPFVHMDFLRVVCILNISFTCCVYFLVLVLLHAQLLFLELPLFKYLFQDHSMYTQVFHLLLRPQLINNLSLFIVFCDMGGIENLPTWLIPFLTSQYFDENDKHRNTGKASIRKTR